ncbi:MAG: ROK family transcriptional regulator [Angustibacter sp.]
MNPRSTPDRRLARRLRPHAKALPEHARQHNRSLVLQSLFHSGPSSRADLARETGLTRVTVSDLVASLIDDGLVSELGAKPGSRVGKPATLVGLRHDAHQVLAVDISDADWFHGAVLDLTGTVLERRRLPVEGRTGTAAVELVERLCRDLVDVSTRPLLGVGIATPGLVDGDGVVLQAPNLGWSALPLAQLLDDALDLPVHVANDANTAALGEYTFGAAGEHGLMLIRVGKGVGAGLLLDGALLAGQHLAAGEIGHLVVDEDGEPCACGRRGCLETVLAVPSLRRRTEGADEAAREAALRAAGEALGVTLAPVVSALDLREVVLSGPADLLGGPLLDAALTVLRRRCMPVVGEDVELRLPAAGTDVVLAGAAVLVLSGQLGVS